MKISSYKVENLSNFSESKYTKCVNKKGLNMVTAIILPTLLSMNGKQRPLVTFVISIENGTKR